MQIYLKNCTKWNALGAHSAPREWLDGNTATESLPTLTLRETRETAIAGGLLIQVGEFIIEPGEEGLFQQSLPEDVDDGAHHVDH